MPSFSPPLKAIVLILLTLLLVGFVESAHIYTLMVGGQDSLLKNPILAYTAFAGNIKSLVLAEKTTESKLPLENQDIEQTPLPSYVMPGPPYRVIIIGDSFIAEKFGPILEKELLSYQDTSAYRTGIYSTGLSRPDYFDWNEKVKELIVSYQPNVAIVMFGANDGQDIRTKDGKIIHYDTPKWDGEYADRVSAFVRILQEHNIAVFWVGTPIARAQQYRNIMQRLNTIYETVLQEYGNAIFIPTWDLLKNAKGEYAAYLPDANGTERLARISDGIHPTSFGAMIMAHGVLKTMKEHIHMERISSEKEF